MKYLTLFTLVIFLVSSTIFGHQGQYIEGTIDIIKNGKTQNVVFKFNIPNEILDANTRGLSEKEKIREIKTTIIKTWYFKDKDRIILPEKVEVEKLVDNQKKENHWLILLTFLNKEKLFFGAQKFSPVIFQLNLDHKEVGKFIYQAGGIFSLDSVLKKFRLPTFTEIVLLGIEHIIPKGIDHILFILGLFFLSTKWSVLFWQVLAFTLAHGITLFIGTAGDVNISARIVESIIAASIVFVGFENIFIRKFWIGRGLLVFLFGLIHGLGFASVFRDLKLSIQDGLVKTIFAFNIGVEVGQLLVIALAYLLVGKWFSQKSWYFNRIIRPVSVLIMLIGSYWTIQRALF